MLDEARYQELYHAHYQLLYSIGKLFLADFQSQAVTVEDVIQDTFLLLWEKRHKLEKHPNLPGWLVETMRKKLLNAIGKSARRAKQHLPSLDSFPPDSVTLEDKTFSLPEEALLDKSGREALETLLGKEDAELFRQYFINNVTAKALSQSLNLSPDCIRMRAARLRKKVLANKSLFLGIIALLFVRF